MTVSINVFELVPDCTNWCSLSLSLYRKKLSKFVQHPDWNNASNYVAKCYMKEAPRDVYFEDVKLQMDSKLWGEKYNQLTVPKKVCVCICA